MGRSVNLILGGIFEWLGSLIRNGGRQPQPVPVKSRFGGTLSFIFLFCAFLVSNSILAQDLHFSQFHQSPLTTNPANTGFIPDADYRVGLNYRNQWSSIMATPYKTMSLYGDAQVMRDRFENGWIGLGGVILRDVAGSGQLTSTKVYGSVAYHQMLGYSSLLTAGFNIGVANKRIDFSKLTFPDQFDGKFFDNTIPTSVVLAKTNLSYFDMQAGLNYAWFPDDNTYLNGGFSVHHINRPEESFFTEQPGYDTRIPRRYIGFLNGSFKLSDMVIVNPNIYFTSQATSAELVAGGYAQYNLSGDGETQLIGGLYYRLNDAVIPMAGFQWNNLRLTFSYDATMSNLRHYNGMRGAYEFSLVKHGFFTSFSGTRRQVLCPTF
ncbi:MAG TPA: PorP/SprF family type IX secretion system membrane protein [Parasegetibacter sp.]|jgi:type IX secretion system PorP/SprF family membrane protein